MMQMFFKKKKEIFLLIEPQWLTKNNNNNRKQVSLRERERERGKKCLFFFSKHLWAREIKQISHLLIEFHPTPIPLFYTIVSNVKLFSSSSNLDFLFSCVLFIVALKNNNATTTFLFFGVIRDFLIVFLSFLIEDINIYSKFDYIIFLGLIERFVLNFRIFSYIHTTAPRG